MRQVHRQRGRSGSEIFQRDGCDPASPESHGPATRQGRSICPEDVDPERFLRVDQLYKSLTFGTIRMDMPEKKALRQSGRYRCERRDHNVYIVESAYTVVVAQAGETHFEREAAGKRELTKAMQREFVKHMADPPRVGGREKIIESHPSHARRSASPNLVNCAGSGFCPSAVT